jgi:uncharacterized protein
MFPVSILVATCAMLSGIGGAALFTPIFILLFPLLGPEYTLASTMTAIAAALFTQTFGFMSGFVGYYRRKLIDYELAKRILWFSIPVAVAGAVVANAVSDSVLIASYSILVAVLAFVMWRNPIKPGDPAVHLEGRVVIEKTDSRGQTYSYDRPVLGAGSYALTGVGAFLTGMVSVGIGEVTISQLTRKNIPIAVAAATSVLVVILTVVFASATLFIELIRAGGWTAVPWDLLVYDIPGVLIGGQIGPRLQGLVPQHRMRQAISLLFIFLAIAMMFVATQKAGSAQSTAPFSVKAGSLELLLMSETTIIERQQQWLNDIKAADAFDGGVADYARAEGLTPKELYQWKTILTRRGLLPGQKIRSDFVPVATPPVWSSVASLLLPDGVRLEFGDQ